MARYLFKATIVYDDEQSGPASYIQDFIEFIEKKHPEIELVPIASVDASFGAICLNFKNDHKETP